ncbi:MAG TPA: SIR2 family protein [Herbaspirillum sp.]|uniref:SIR2 family protein n=1 Tax=Herbaspirillum sp. TaxID=1890675 RepID=UPI002D23AB2C|nr:SIR2 family protein [Herbaspirillum sp.]HZG19618.1 SIR2 family protein [Herbaspirillum sp.]
MKKLKQILSQEDTVLFVGSGISLWSELPTWGGLIEELAKYVETNGRQADLIRTEAKRGDLLQAASYGFDMLTKQQIGEFIRSACRYGTAKPHAIHQKIVSLGPRCFITTNYDDLIEQSLRKWQPERFYKPPITNRHLTETAEIVHARALDFIFKPHGDAGDSESIILTREQYRQLLPQGERHAALEAVKMLLASRPVVYLGFGLRDPDFLYIRDLLANIFKGGTRDHYAIIADVSEGEIAYWQRNYGIHLLGYETLARPDNSRDHSQLASMLDELLKPTVSKFPPAAFVPDSLEVRLSLARHASALMRVPNLASELTIRVHSIQKASSRLLGRFDKFDHERVDLLLDSGPPQAVLLGLPGAGKTFALRRSASRLAESLNEACLSDTFNHRDVLVPIFIDLKLYRGNLAQLVGETLPNGLPLTDLIKAFRVKIFFDSFNEMPREYWENGSYESDFQSFIQSVDCASVIIGSRSDDGLSKLNFPTYSLDEIDHETVINELKRLGLTITGRFSNEAIRLIQRPFYFQYIAAGTIKMPGEAHPRDFYRCFFENENEALSSRFGITMDLEKALAKAAYESLNNGEEAFLTTELLGTLKRSLNVVGIEEVSAQDIANWLVSRSVLLPYSGSRVAFVHQSITEYLAATELATRYLNDPKTLKNKLALTRWDQTLLLTLSMLPAAEAESFLEDVIETDLTLALTSAKYLEADRDAIIARLLTKVADLEDYSSRQTWKVEALISSDLPISVTHEIQLREIVARGGSLASAAVIRLVDIFGSQVKDEMLRLLLDRRGDFNLCVNGVGRALEMLATQKDAATIAAWADSIQSEDSFSLTDDRISGFTSGATRFLSKLDFALLRRELMPSDQVDWKSSVRLAVLCEIANENKSTAALEFSAEMLLHGVPAASSAIYFIASHREGLAPLSWDCFAYDHVKCLTELLNDKNNQWAVDALICLCKARQDLAAIVEQIAHRCTGIRRMALLHCVSPSDFTLAHEELSEIVSIEKQRLSIEPIHLLGCIRIDWADKEELLVEILRTRDRTLVSHILGHMVPVGLHNLGEIEIGDIQFWLDWMAEESNQKNTDNLWFLSQLGSLFANYVCQEKLGEFVTEFNSGNSKYRGILSRYILVFCNGLTTDVFSEDAISFMLANLNRNDPFMHFRGHILSHTATERFIEERILPLLPKAQSPLLENLSCVLSDAGARLGRRFVVE